MSRELGSHFAAHRYQREVQVVLRLLLLSRARRHSGHGQARHLGFQQWPEKDNLLKPGHTDAKIMHLLSLQYLYQVVDLYE